MKKIGLILLLGLLAVLTAGCTFSYDTNIRADQSGTLVMGFGYTESEGVQLLDSLSAEDASKTLCQTIMADAATDLPPGAALREEIRAGESWCYLDAKFTNLQELRSFYGETVQVNRLEVVDDQLYYDVTLDASDLSLLGNFKVIWKVTMPGAVQSNNADSVSGRVLTWETDTAEVLHMQAVSSLASPTWIWWVGGTVLCLCILVVVIAGVVLLIVTLKKKKSQKTETALAG